MWFFLLRRGLRGDWATRARVAKEDRLGRRQLGKRRLLLSGKRRRGWWEGQLNVLFQRMENMILGKGCVGALFVGKGREKVQGDLQI